MNVLSGGRVAPAEVSGGKGAVAAPLRLAVDARIWKTGIGTYTLNLMRAVRRLDSGVRIQAIVRAEAKEAMPGMCDEMRVVDAPIYGLQEQFRVPEAAEGCDLLHVPHYNVPALYRGPMVVTIHDLTHLTDPEFRHTAKAWLYGRPMLKIAARKAQHVITVSEYSKRRIVERLGAEADKVSAIYNGVDPQFRPGNRDEAVERVNSKLEIGRPFVLFVGNLKPHKNLERLLLAFARVHAQKRADHALVLVGDDRKRRQGLLDLCTRLGISESVRHVRWADYDLLPQLYRAAEMVVMPSTSEGFGFPVVEAMACGTPVACSNATSLPEVGGEAAEYFDPLSVEEMAAVMERVLDSPGLQAEMREKGLKQAAKFTWEECARKHVEVYRRALAP